MDNDIFEALFEIVTFFNQPQQDRQLLKQANLTLEPAALPITCELSAAGISIGELANQIGEIIRQSVVRSISCHSGWLVEVGDGSTIRQQP